MKRHSLPAIILVLAWCATLRADILPAHSAPTPTRVAALWPDLAPRQTPHPAVVRVIAPERGAMSLGSGTLVDANEVNGLVITNWHVVKDAQGPIEVVFPGGFRSPASVVRMDREWDLASLLVNRPPGVQPVPVTTAAPRPGEPLKIAGYGSGNYKMQSGQCTQYLAPGTNRPFEIVEVSAAARHGDSGGPILNSRGELAGVLFGEGGGRTSGSYGGRVHNFLQLTAMDLQRMPASNIAANRPAAGTVAAGTVAAARFRGGINDANPEDASGAPAYESAAPRVAGRPSGPKQWDGDGPRPLVIAPPRYQPSDSSRESSNVAVATRSKGKGFVWRDELKSLLAAFGIAALILHGLNLLRPRKRK